MALASGAPGAQAIDPAALADGIDAYLRAKGSLIAGEGANIVAVGQQYNIDPRLLVALAGANVTAGAFVAEQGADVTRLHFPSSKEGKQ